MASSPQQAVKLYQHPDFESAVEQASEWKPSAGWRPALIEKDYFVTEALRIIAMTAGERVIFKGGTSLSKGWGLIERFSEDIDIFLEPPASKNAINRELKALRDTVAAHSGLTFLPEESRTIGGFGRSDRFLYLQRFPEPAVVNQILCEVGTASGREPTETVSLSSFLAHFLTATGVL